MISKKIEELIIKSILATFSDTKSIIIFGSAVDDGYIDGISDIDVLVVLDNDQTDKKKLLILNNIFDKSLSIDVMLTTIKDLNKDIDFVSLTQERPMHSIEKYQIKNESKVIFGDLDILDVIEDITLQKALDNELPYIKNVFIRRLKEELEKTNNISEFLINNLNILLVVVRVIYTQNEGRLISKIKALDYVGHKFDLIELCNYLKAVYSKKDLNDIEEPNRKSIEKLLDIQLE